MTDTENDLVSLAVQLTQAAMGTKGEWVNHHDDVVEFITAVHATLVKLRFPARQSQ